MQCCESACDVFEQCREGAVQRGMAGDNDIIAGGARVNAGGCCECGLQSPANPVADDGIADLFGNGEAKARSCAVFRCGTFSHFDQECGRGRSASATDGQEFRARFQSLQCRDSGLQSWRSLKLAGNRDKMRVWRWLYHDAWGAVNGSADKPYPAASIMRVNERAGNRFQRAQCTHLENVGLRLT